LCCYSSVASSRTISRNCTTFGKVWCIIVRKYTVLLVDGRNETISRNARQGCLSACGSWSHAKNYRPKNFE
jgi:hypothetical protein